jgi:hypothetical protein
MHDPGRGGGRRGAGIARCAALARARACVLRCSRAPPARRLCCAARRGAAGSHDVRAEGAARARLCAGCPPPSATCMHACTRRHDRQTATPQRPWPPWDRRASPALTAVATMTMMMSCCLHGRRPSHACTHGADCVPCLWLQGPSWRRRPAGCCVRPSRCGQCAGAPHCAHRTHARSHRPRCALQMLLPPPPR